MHRNVETIKIDDKVVDAARRMRDRDIGFLPVVDTSGKAVGTITDRDITIRAVADQKDGVTRVSDIMTRDIVTCRPGDDIDDCTSLMATWVTSPSRTRARRATRSPR
jgi:CBS domain-containing protein